MEGEIPLVWKDRTGSIKRHSAGIHISKDEEGFHIPSATFHRPLAEKLSKVGFYHMGLGWLL